MYIAVNGPMVYLMGKASFKILWKNFILKDILLTVCLTLKVGLLHMMEDSTEEKLDMGMHTERANTNFMTIQFKGIFRGINHMEKQWRKGLTMSSKELLNKASGNKEFYNTIRGKPHTKALLRIKYFRGREN